MSEEKLSWRTLHIVWLLLALLFGGIAFLVIKNPNPGFANAMVYALSAVIIAELVFIKAQRKEPNILAMLVGALFACFPVIVAAGSFDANVAMWFSGLGIVAVWIINNQDSFVDYRDERASDLAVAPMVVWAFWAFIFLYQHLSGTLALTWQSGIYHLGILLFSGYSALRLLGVLPENERTQKWGIYLLILAVFGLLLVTNLGQALAFA